MKALYLTHVDPARRALAMRAVKIALMAVGVEASKALEEASKAVRLVDAGRGPAGIVGPGVGDDAVADAYQVLMGALKGHEDAVKISLQEYEPPSEEAEPRGVIALDAPARGSIEWIEQEFGAPTPENFTPTAAERKTALMIMQLTNGNPQVAWFTAKQFCRNTEQYEFWVNVNHVLTETFVWPTQKT